MLVFLKNCEFRNSRSQMFFKIGVFKNFAKFHRKTPRTFQHMCFPVKYAKIFKNTFFYRKPPMTDYLYLRAPFWKLRFLYSYC